MEKSEVRAIVEREAESLLRSFGVSPWKLTIAYDLVGDEQLGECSRLLDYQTATIRLNPSLLDDEAAVLSTLRHELLHIVLSPLDLYTATVGPLVEGPLRDVLERVWTHALERTVINLERLHRGLTSDQRPPADPVDS